MIGVATSSYMANCWVVGPKILSKANEYLLSSPPTYLHKTIYIDLNIFIRVGYTFFSLIGYLDLIKGPQPTHNTYRITHLS